MRSMLITSHGCRGILVVAGSYARVSWFGTRAQVTRLDVQLDIVFLTFPKKTLFDCLVRLFPSRMFCECVIVLCKDHVLFFDFWDDYGCVFAQIYTQKTVGKNISIFFIRSTSGIMP